MIQKTITLIFVALSIMAFKGQQTEVAVCGTIHGVHKANPSYSYADLTAFIERYNPDIIGVEIRNEDIDSSVTYLKRNYPLEMYTCIGKYKHSKVIYGIDWLGKDLEGAAIPSNYWTEVCQLKVLERQLSKDSTMLKPMAALDSINELRMQHVLKNNLYELNGGAYDSLNGLYYQKLEAILGNTPYRELVQFYKDRDTKIADNIERIVRNNPGKRILILTGIDHRRLAVSTLKERMGNSILLDAAFSKSR